MTILLSDPSVAAVALAECGDQRAIITRYAAEVATAHPGAATPEQSQGRCFTDSPTITPRARAHRALLGAVLGSAGLVNYPTEWWHWSWGDRYWALTSGAPAAVYGPVGRGAGVAA
ncbi:M15 family metallopeptidase [Nocardioides zeae]|uniref:M15 family metallopeptidase n=1 Tax=Nocardioides zeae TaxID=1457234 RepID=A0A6P0HF70_9ACTN|nr:M15 family metallopeptidase [Nocardioides zeae]NEN76920.1 M15 family metallopeptidase [Nocardioides zeae]